MVKNYVFKTPSLRTPQLVVEAEERGTAPQRTVDMERDVGTEEVQGPVVPGSKPVVVV